MPEQNGKRQTKLATILLAAGLLLVINSTYLAAFGDPSLFYVANSLIHPLLGIVVAILFAAFVAKNRNLFAGLAGAGSVVFLALAAAFGLYLAVVGMIRPHSLALYMHVTCAIGGLFLVLLRLHRRSREVEDCAGIRR